ncbi:NUDIX hydrolase [Microbacterium sp. CFBP 8794]|uniref:NUDIX hydrolase n=1 Tax=Microbacterium sp. CFBP 8794 TaxID=2775269 RepID=UPI00177D6374|nr:NUDIX domain-containing protein [Microbacterium sp. CFBP 8794]MBD8478942.1 NUDIX domain-containing protein [Microbacterium sp. CFBP 8794]
MEMSYRHSVSVAGVVYDERIDSFLVIERMDNGAWQLPGGVLEKDEDPRAGAIREVFEETGVDVEPLHLSGVYKNTEIGVIALVFRCQIKNGTPRATAEARSVRWMPRAEIESSMPPAFACRLLDTLGDAMPYVRSHDGINLIG